MIKSTLNKGFQMEFENGISISVQFGTGNYCSNRDESAESDWQYNKPYVYGCSNAEILIEHNKIPITEEFVEQQEGIRGDGRVAGYVPTDVVAEAIIWAKNYKVKVG